MPSKATWPTSTGKRSRGNQVLLQRDLAVLQRNIKQIRSEANEVDSAAWDGISEGLQSCTE